MPELVIVIVNYNAGNYLLGCLKSLDKLIDKIKLKIIVVDNASVDDSIKNAKQEFPNIEFILNQKNLGFAKANNLVLNNLTTEYVLILNPDMILESGVLTKLLDYLVEHPEVGAITPEIIFENGQVDRTAHRGFPTPWASFLYFLGNDRLYHLTDLDMTIPHEVDAITGAFFLTRKSVLDIVGVFDEDYFMYAEDLDLCFRIKQFGFKVIYFPAVSVVHYKGISSGLKSQTQHLSTADKQIKLRSLNYFYQTMKIFYRKHLAINFPFFINWLVYLGINLRWYLAKRKMTV